MKKADNLSISNKDALIIADVQNDFLPGGALAIKNGDQVIPAVNEYTKIFKNANAKIVASMDWHPSKHVSFLQQGGLWPPHCVQNTEGAEFSSKLKLPEGAVTVSKATNPVKEAYSVFEGTGLAELLKAQGITRVFVSGLATDYCVVNSVLDARKLGFDVVVLMDAIKGIDVKPGDVDRAIEAMVKSGATQMTLADFPEPELLIGEESAAETIGDKPLSHAEVKKTARMRPRGSYKQVRRERG